MDGLNPSPGRGDNNGGIEPELKPDCGASAFKIKVAHGLNEHEVVVPSNSTFGDLKSVIAQKIGLNPEAHKLLFRGKEKEDDDDLQTAGVKDNSKVLIAEDITSKQKNPEEVKETTVISRGGAAVAEVKEEVDMLSEQVSALQAVVDCGTQVDDKDIVYLTEMLMRQLLKLDSIDAEGEGRVQRKMEVRRVQSLVETMDILKSRNSDQSSNVNNAVSVTTQWETFESGGESVTAPSQMPPSTSTPISMPKPPATFTSAEIPAHSTPPSIPTPVPSSTPASIQAPSSTSIPAQFSAPMPSTTKVTHDWEQFD